MKDLYGLLRFARRRMKEKGLPYILKKSFINAVQRPVMSRVNYCCYRSRYSTPLIYVAGQAKGGSTWFGKMFSSLPGFQLLTPLKWKIAASEEWTDFESTDLSPEIFNEFKKKLVVVKHHTWGFPENVKLLNEWCLKHLISVRDPRDILISNYYYALKHPENWDYKNAKDKNLEEYIQLKLDSGDWNRQFVDWARSWVKNRNPGLSYIIRYEDALDDVTAEMRKALDFLDIEVSDDLLNKIIEANSFEAMSGRKQGEEDTKSFHRKGISGEWRKVFSMEQKRISFQQAKDVISELGYSSE